jgi:hypothetical protein
MATTKKKASPRSVSGASRVEKTGIYAKGPTGQKRYSSGAPARGTQTRKDILSDLNKLVKYVKTGKFKNYSEKKKVWAQIDNYRVALGTLKETKRKSKSNATGTTTYDAGSIKVRKEAGFSRDSGRGGGRKSTQMADGGKGKSKPKTTPKYKQNPVFVNVGSASDFMPFDGAHPEKSARTRPVQTKNGVRVPAEKAKQGESRKDYIVRKYNEGLAAGGKRGR